MDERKCDVNIDISKQKYAKYYLIPSLQHMSKCIIVITLWNHADIKHQIVRLVNEYDGSHKRSYELEIEDEVSDKVFQLPLPDPVKKDVADFTHPIGKEIVDWIMYHDQHIFNIGYFGHPNVQSIAINYIHNLVWKSRGVIDYKKTAKILLAIEGNLSDNNKYKFACEYCLEDDIAVIPPSVDDVYLHLGFIERQLMVYYWISYGTGDFTEFDKSVRAYNRRSRTNYSRNECIFRVLTENRTSEVAVKYMWDKLSNEEKSRQIITAIRKSNNIDLRCFFLSQMSEEQEKEFFESRYAKGVLLGFLDNWLWELYFLPTVHHVWDILSASDYLAVLQHVVNKMNKNHEDAKRYSQYKDIFNELWKCAPQSLKESVFEGQNWLEFSQSVLFKLSWEKNVDIVRSILFNSNYVQKMKILFSEKGIRKCEHFITSDKWDVIDKLIDSTLISEEFVESFKHRFIRERGRNIAQYFMRNNEWGKADHFIQWTIKSEEGRRKFRQKLVFSRICGTILDSMVENSKSDFTELEHLFKWCSIDDEETVLKYKAKIPEFYFGQLICRLIQEDKYQLLELILHWCFVNDRTQIDAFKQNIYYDNKRFKIVELVLNLVKQNDQLQSLKKFANYWCSTDKEISKLKTCILHPIEDGSICVRLLWQSEFGLTDDLVDWCCNSSQIKINKFKNQLMISDVMRHFPVRDNSLEFFETKFIRWFNPSVDTIRRFKEKFANLKWFIHVVPALDNFVQEHYNEDETINKEDANA